MAIPDCRDVVSRLAAQYPDEWKKAHKPSGGGPETEAFIRRVAYVLHTTVDPHFGLTGKRGDPNDISDDALCYDGVSVLGDRDPTRGNAPVTVIDVIGGAGGPNPTVTWNPVGPAPSAAWVKPEPVGSGSADGGTPSPTSPQPTGPDLTPILNTLKSLDAKITTIGELVLAQRATLDQAAFESLNAASRASEIKTQIENLPKPGGATAFPRYRGKFLGAAVTLDPEPR